MISFVQLSRHISELLHSILVDIILGRRVGTEYDCVLVNVELKVNTVIQCTCTVVRTLINQLDVINLACFTLEWTSVFILY